MSKPWVHAESSVRHFGGVPEDYIHIHQFMDMSKEFYPNIFHRAIHHNSHGCFLVEDMFGYRDTNSDGRKFYPRDIAEQHCQEDCSNTIPTVEMWLSNLKEDHPLKRGMPKMNSQIHDRLEVLNLPIFMMNDFRGGAIYHHSYGVSVINKVYGASVAYEAKRYIQKRYGFIPTMRDWFDGCHVRRWMGPTKQR